MAKLHTLRALEVLDSRGRPTIEVEATASSGEVGRAIVPSGASTGRHEAVELRDRQSPRYGGRGVAVAVANVEGEIARAVLGTDIDDQIGLDLALIAIDGTADKSRLGGNATLGVSLAFAHAAAAAHHEELYVHLNRLWKGVLGTDGAAEYVMPMPMVNLISGGRHAGGNLDFQDFLVVPVGSERYRDALERIVSLYHALSMILSERSEEGVLVGDEGGFGPKLATNAVALERIIEAIQRCGLVPGRDVSIALDVAASQFYNEPSGKYTLAESGVKTELGSDRMIELLSDWTLRAPIVSIEDALAEDDWEGWRNLTKRLGSTTQLVGDDLFTTRSDRLERGIRERSANAILIKPNQAGTLTETLRTLALARKNGYRAIVSARSGETEDTTIADLAVATGVGQIKIGSVARSERLAKYNRLLRIEQGLAGNAEFARPFRCL